jgi:hypothetical protein
LAVEAGLALEVKPASPLKPRMARNIQFYRSGAIADHLAAGIWGLSEIFHNMSYANPVYAVAGQPGL